MNFCGVGVRGGTTETAREKKGDSLGCGSSLSRIQRGMSERYVWVMKLGSWVLEGLSWCMSKMTKLGPLNGGP